MRYLIIVFLSDFIFSEMLKNRLVQPKEVRMKSKIFLVLAFISVPVFAQESLISYMPKLI